MTQRQLPRPVRVYHTVSTPKEGGGYTYPREVQHARGLLHAFGIDSIEGPTEVVHNLCAVVELPDGSMIVPHASMIQFLDADAPGVSAPARPSRPVKEILRLADVIAKTSLSKSAIYRAREAGTFPEPVKLLGSRAVGWRRGDIDAWLAAPADYRTKKGEF